MNGKDAAQLHNEWPWPRSDGSEVTGPGGASSSHMQLCCGSDEKRANQKMSVSSGKEDRSCRFERKRFRRKEKERLEKKKKKKKCWRNGIANCYNPIQRPRLSRDSKHTQG